MRLRVLAAACLVILAGCDSNPAQPTCTFTLSTTSMTMGAAGGAGSVTVTTGNQCAWTASSGVSWITTTGGTAATGPGAFTFNVAALASAASRNGSLTVAGQAVAVTQQGMACAYALLPASRTVDAAGGTASFDVNTDTACGWTAAPSVAWLTLVSGGSGSGNATVTYRVAANPDAATRTGSLTVGGSAHSVTQSGLTSCTVDLNKYQDSFSVAGGTGSFDVSASSSCAWVAASAAGWARVTDPSGGLGTGSRRVTYVVDGSADAAPRSGSITVGGRTFTITQAGTTACDYSVAPVDFRECPQVGARSVAITTAAGCPWTSSTPASWITISSGRSGTGPGAIAFSIASNYDAGERQANIEVRWPAPTAGQNVRVVQAGCGYAVDTSSFPAAFPVAGGDFSFWVFSSSTDNGCGGPLQNACFWTAQTTASWITILSQMPQYGYDRVSFRIAANGTGVLRTATITLRDKTVTVRQAGS
ncbi:MAG: hypothetical protein MUE61_18755 [Vicinamibacterales bacterium]|jgi:hypothetical protein|nr:hypothetical protein [Vicinamibacterales bacterium]